MSWRDRLVEASWRGIKLNVERTEDRFGQRLVESQFAYSNLTRVDDLGAEAPQWSLTCWFWGDDYDIRRNNFLEALAQGGAATLYHPTLGPLWARAKSWSVSESTQQAGSCSVQVSFIGGGDRLLQTARADLTDLAIEAAKNWAASATADYQPKPTSAAKATALVQRTESQMDKIRNALALARAPLAYIQNIQSQVAEVKGMVRELMSLPGAYADALKSLAAQMGLGVGSDDLSDTDRARLVWVFANQAMQLASAAPAKTTASNEAEASLLMAQLEATSAVQMATATYAAAPERDQSVAALELMFVSLRSALPPASALAMIDTRSRVLLALQAQQLPALRQLSLPVPLPDVVVARCLGSTVEAVRQRNAGHPLFLTGVVRG